MCDRVGWMDGRFVVVGGMIVVAVVMIVMTMV